MDKKGKDTKIMKLTIKDNKFTCDPPMNSVELCNQLLSVVMTTMKQDVLAAPEDKKEATTAYLYDTFNLMASEFLKQFAPEYDMRPDLTELAIMKAQDELLKEAMEKKEGN